MTGQEIVTARADVPAVQSATVPTAVADLREWATTYRAVAEFVSALIDTPFVPAAFRPEAFVRGRPDERSLAVARDTAVASAAGAVLFGASVGFDPLTSLQNVFVVGGRPGLYAAAMVAIVQAAGHDIWTEDITDTRAVVCGRRKGGPEERVVVTMDQARRAGWTRNSKYAAEPQAMLWARAASTVCRRIAQDALKGVGRSVEELHDEVTVSDGPEPRSRQVRRRAVTAPPPTPDPPQPTVEAADPATPPPERTLPPLPGETADADSADSPPGITREQSRAMHAGWGELGIRERDERLTWAAELVGRPLGSSSDLTRAEAGWVIESIHAAIRQRDADQEMAALDDQEETPQDHIDAVAHSDPDDTPTALGEERPC